MKIKKIHVKNFKAVSDEELSLNGCSAIVTAGNEKGKTSILTGLIDRLHSDFPEVIVKEGEDKGYNIIELTDGSRIEWNFTEKSERFAYITVDGIKQTAGVIGAIGERYFGKKFDIDDFLRSGPKKQQEWMESLSGIDISEIEDRYKEAYEDRTDANRELKRIRARKLEEPENIEEPDVDSIKEGLKKARDQNEIYGQATNKIESLAEIEQDVIRVIGGTDYEDLFNRQEAKNIRENIEVPEIVNVSELEKKLDEAQEQLRKYDSYERDFEEYQEWVKAGKRAAKEAEAADKKVKAIEQEKKEAIAKADLPEGFNITGTGLTYKGYILDENQLAKSQIYIAALKLGSMVLGEVKTLHFDASTLDKNSLEEVKEWADSKGLQLLIERPDWDDGDIQYKIIEG